MSVRDLGPDDLVPAQHLSSLAFASPVRATGPGPLPPGAIHLGIDAPDGSGLLAARASILEDVMATAGGGAPLGAVGSVSVHPAYRGGGLFRELMTAVIDRGARAGHAFSMLYPSNPGIYRALGYQVITRVQRVIVPMTALARLRPVPGRRLVPVHDEQGFAVLRGLYRELAAQENGLLLREGPAFGDGSVPARPWEGMLLVDDAGAAHGYLSFARTADGPGDTGLEIFDLYGRTREDTAALLASLGTWSTMTDAVLVRLRAEDPLLDVLPGGRILPDPRILPEVMLRVVDVAAALASRPAPAGLHGTLRLVVEDPTVPAGVGAAAGDLLVTIHEGAVHARRLPGADPHAVGLHEDPTPPDVSAAADDVAAHARSAPRARLDVHSASLLLAGGRRLADARRQGLLVEADPEAEALLDALLAGPRPSVLDFF